MSASYCLDKNSVLCVGSYFSSNTDPDPEKMNASLTNIKIYTTLSYIHIQKISEEIKYLPSRHDALACFPSSVRAEIKTETFIPVEASWVFRTNMADIHQYGTFSRLTSQITPLERVANFMKNIFLYESEFNSTLTQCRYLTTTKRINFAFFLVVELGNPSEV